MMLPIRSDLHMIEGRPGKVEIHITWPFAGVSTEIDFLWNLCDVEAEGSVTSPIFLYW